MKKRIICVLIFILCVLGYGIHAFSSEVETENEEITYPMQAFGDKSINGISVSANVDEGVFPRETEIRTFSVSQEVEEQIKEAANKLINSDQIVVDLKAIEICFFNNEKQIQPKLGKNVHLEIYLDNAIKGDNFLIVHFENSEKNEIISSDEINSTWASFDVSSFSVKTDPSNIDIEEISTNSESTEASIIQESYSIYSIIGIESINAEKDSKEYENIIDKEDGHEDSKEDENVINKEDNHEDSKEEGVLDKENDYEDSKEEEKEVDKEDNYENSKEENVIDKENDYEDSKEEEEVDKENNHEDSKEESVIDKKNDHEDSKEEEKEADKEDNYEVDREEKKKDKEDNHKVEIEEHNEDKNGETVESNMATIDSSNIKKSYEVETIEVKGELIWIDGDNQDGIRPKSVKVNLLADNNQIDTVNVYEKDKWKFSFGKLPMYDSGKEITYVVEKESIEGYKTKTKGFNIKYIHSPEQITIEVKNIWDDEDNKDGIRPRVVTVTLMANGKKIDEKPLTESKAWTHTFKYLPKCEDGKEITYTIQEITIEGYTTTINDFEITNTHKPKLTYEPENDTHPDKTSRERKTHNVFLWIVIMSFIIVAVIGWTYYKKKNE